MRILIRDGRLIDPSQGVDEVCDVLVEDGQIVDRGRFPGAVADEVVVADGLWVIPGLIDMHVHLRVPGQEWKETMATGTRAAAAGGFTAVAAIPNTRPPIDSAALVRGLRQLAAEQGLVRVHAVGAVTAGQAGGQLAELAAMAEAGAVAFSDDGHPVANAALMRHAMSYARMLGLPILDHAEEPGLAGHGVMHEGSVASAMGLAGQPAEAESAGVARDLEIARLTGCHLHIMHVSTRASVALIRKAKAEGVHVSAEATPHHLLLTEAEVRNWGYDAVTKVNPPLRSEDDRQAVLEAYLDGTLDIIATDHAPHSAEEKAATYAEAPFGISGLETALALLITELTEKGLQTPLQLIERMSTRPAQLFNLPGGTLRRGATADLALVDPAAGWIVDPGRFYSLGKHTPFAGRRLQGRTVATMVAGKFIWRSEG